MQAFADFRDAARQTASAAGQSCFTRLVKLPAGFCITP